MLRVSIPPASRLQAPRNALQTLVSRGPTGYAVDEKEHAMGINTESDIAANLQIGPTDKGMVRIFVEADTAEIPMDFDPDEADEIAREIAAAAEQARAISRKSPPRRGR